MKVALLFSGLVRTLEQTWPVNRAHFARYTPDIYYYLNEPEKADIVKSLMHPRHLIAEADPLLPENNYSLRLGPGLRSVQNDLRQMYGLMRVNQMCRSSGIAYDWVIRLRADIEITQAPEPLESLDPSFIYIPRINNWFGYSDRFAMAVPALMDIYMERYPAFDAFFQDRGVFQMESFLAYHLRSRGISVARSRILFDMVKMDQLRDKPFWSPEWGDVP